MTGTADQFPPFSEPPPEKGWRIAVKIPLDKISRAWTWLQSKRWVIMKKFFVLLVMFLALTGTAFADSTPSTTDIVSSISQYVQQNTNAESTLGVVFGRGLPVLGVGEYISLYNAPSGSKLQYSAGFKYTGVVAGNSMNLLGLGIELKLLPLLPGSVPPPLGIINPSLNLAAENDVSKIFQRWAGEVSLSVINVKFGSILGL